MRSIGKYLGQLFLFSFVIGFVLLQTYCGPRIMPQDACGFAQNSLGQRISWKHALPVKLYFDPSFPQDMRAQVTAAINVWETEGLNGSKKLFTIAGDSTRPPAHDNSNVLYWMTQWSQTTDTSKNEQANTLAWWADNQMIENDVYVNASSQVFQLATAPSPGVIDVKSLMIHELGHVLGLKHVDSEPSVMNKNLEFGQDRQHLYPIDVADLKCEY